MDLELSRVEATLLRDILVRYLGDLRVEIGRTGKLEDRQDLHRTETTLKALIGRLDDMLSNSE